MGANYQKQMADRVSSMAYAYDYAVKHGLDALKKELQFRRIRWIQWKCIADCSVLCWGAIAG